MIEVTESTFEEEVLNEERPVVVDFHAEDRCAPCRAMAPVLSALEKDHPDIKFVKLHVDQNPDLARSYMVTSIPVLLRFDGGRRTKGVVGVHPKHILEEVLLY